MHEIATVKVKPWDPDQGDHVIINEEDFDPAVHELLDETKPKPRKARAKE